MPRALNVGVFSSPNLKRFRRIVSGSLKLGMGVATSVGWTANARTIRHCIEARTDPGAEEEIRLVFGKIAKIVTQEYPNLFGDYIAEEVEGIPWYKTNNSKI